MVRHAVSAGACGVSAVTCEVVVVTESIAWAGALPEDRFLNVRGRQLQCLTLHTHAHACTHAHTHARGHMYSRCSDGRYCAIHYILICTHARGGGGDMYSMPHATHIRTHTHTHVHTRTHARTHTHTREGTCTLGVPMADAVPCTHTHMHARTGGTCILASFIARLS